MKAVYAVLDGVYINLIYSDITADEDRFLGAIIVLEEFCKELAAISFAKHHIIF